MYTSDAVITRNFFTFDVCFLESKKKKRKYTLPQNDSIMQICIGAVSN